MEILETYKALADESRLRLVRLLSHGYLNVQELTSILGTSQSTVSHHLKVLQSAGVVKGYRDGTWIYYGLETDGRNRVAAEITQNFLSLSLPLATPEDNRAGGSDVFGRDHHSLAAVLARRRDEGHAFFEGVASRWNEVRLEAIGGASFVTELTRHVPPTATVLEVGCGSGAVLSEILPRPGVTIGVDYAVAMLDEARRNLGRRASAVDLRIGQAEHLPVGDTTVDIVIAHMVLHHCAQPPLALKEMWRVLRPGGQLLVADLTKHANESMRERFADLWLGFDGAEFSGWVTAAGFSAVTHRILGEHATVFLIQAVKEPRPN